MVALTLVNKRSRHGCSYTQGSTPQKKQQAQSIRRLLQFRYVACLCVICASQSRCRASASCRLVLVEVICVFGMCFGCVLAKSMHKDHVCVCMCGWFERKSKGALLRLVAVWVSTGIHVSGSTTGLVVAIKDLCCCQRWCWSFIKGCMPAKELHSSAVSRARETWLSYVCASRL
jgi:hypothetical protein